MILTNSSKLSFQERRRKNENWIHFFVSFRYKAHIKPYWDVFVKISFFGTWQPISQLEQNVLRPNETHQTCTKLGLSEHLSFSRSMWINESGNYKNMLQLQLEGQDLIRGLDDDYFLSYSLLVNNKFLSIKLSGVFFG
jgi:hypothetical protein